MNTFTAQGLDGEFGVLGIVFHEQNFALLFAHVVPPDSEDPKVK